MAFLDQIYFDLYIKIDRTLIPSPDEYFGQLMNQQVVTPGEEENPLFNYLMARLKECKEIDLAKIIPREELTPGKYEGTMRGNDPLVNESLRKFWDSMRDRAA